MTNMGIVIRRASNFLINLEIRMILEMKREELLKNQIL